MLAAAAAGVFKVPALVPPLLLGGSLLALGFQVQSIFAVGGGGGSDSSGSRDDPPADPDVEGRHQEVSRCARVGRAVGSRQRAACTQLGAAVVGPFEVVSSASICAA